MQRKVLIGVPSWQDHIINQVILSRVTVSDFAISVPKVKVVIAALVAYSFLLMLRSHLTSPSHCLWKPTVGYSLALCAKV